MKQYKGTFTFLRDSKVTAIKALRCLSADSKGAICGLKAAKDFIEECMNNDNSYPNFVSIQLIATETGTSKYLIARELAKDIARCTVFDNLEELASSTADVSKLERAQPV